MRNGRTVYAIVNDVSENPSYSVNGKQELLTLRLQSEVQMKIFCIQYIYASHLAVVSYFFNVLKRQ